MCVDVWKPAAKLQVTSLRKLSTLFWGRDPILPGTHWFGEAESYYPACLRDIPVYTSPAVELQVCATLPSLFMWVLVIKLSVYACKVSMIEPSLQPRARVIDKEKRRSQCLWGGNKNLLLGQKLGVDPNITNNLPLTVVEHISHPQFCINKKMWASMSFPIKLTYFFGKREQI